MAISNDIDMYVLLQKRQYTSVVKSLSIYNNEHNERIVFIFENLTAINKTSEAPSAKLLHVQV